MIRKYRMHRYLQNRLKDYWDSKIILISGPRQAGKTTLAKMLHDQHAYYNYDIRKDISIFQEHKWDRQQPLVIFDEIHKMKKWKLWLKGLFDDGALKKQRVVVTGSARLDISRKVGDSLAGRYFSYQLFPLDLKELASLLPDENLEALYKKLLLVGGFPEPFTRGTSQFYKLWRKTHTDAILKQDLLPLEHTRDLEGIELLLELLATRVGSTVSFNSLAEDLDRDDKTIKNWIRILENLYVIFRVGPYSNNIARALKKASKFYFFDQARVEGDESQKLENLIALSLKKELEFLSDTEGLQSNLHFIQTQDKKEIDFLVLRKALAPLLIEAKLSDAQASKNFDSLGNKFKAARKLQLVRNLDRTLITKSGTEVRPALESLASLDLRK